MKDFFSLDFVKSAGLEDRFPLTQEEADRVEDALAKDLENLSLDEQEKAVFDLHGISQLTPEDPVLIQEKLQQVHLQLQQLDPTAMQAYRSAEQRNAAYVHHQHLGFLRSERYDPVLTAKKLALHFEVKQQLFGDGEIMGRDVRISDLDEMAYAQLCKGGLQVCPLKDSAGRGIVALKDCSDEGEEQVMALHRAIFYTGTASLRDEEVQRSGIVWIMFNFQKCRDDFEFVETVMRVDKSLPARFEGGHYCYMDPSLRPFVTGIAASFNQADRLRMRQHCASIEEIRFKLQTFGIPVHALPCQEDGSWSTTFHSDFIEAMKLREAILAMPQEQVNPAVVTDEEDPNDDDTNGIHDHDLEDDTNKEETALVPHRFDVLLGKSGAARDHTGNRRASHLCQMYYSIYEQSNKYQKTNIAERIMKIVEESGGRFLKMDADGHWMEADEVSSRNKISHMFRYLRAKESVVSTKEAELTSDSPSTTTTATTVSSSVKRVSSPESTSDQSEQGVSGVSKQQRSFESRRSACAGLWHHFFRHNTLHFPSSTGVTTIIAETPNNILMKDFFSLDLAKSAGLTEDRFPVTLEEADRVEDVLAKELDNLSLDTKEKAVFDVHGISPLTPEDPLLIQQQLEQIEERMKELDPTESEAYRIAERHNADFVHSEHLRFLRSERYDPLWTAKKLAVHFDVKRQLFGDGEIMGREVRQSDLGEKANAQLNKGTFQVCPLKDSSGRGVVCMDSCFDDGKEEFIAMQRAIFYIGTTCLRDEQVQRSGIVWIMFNYANFTESYQFFESLFRVKKTLPARLEAGHYCYTDPNIRPYVAGIASSLNQADRLRLRQHCASQEEIRFKLQTFGIPVHALPCQEDGSWSTAFHAEYWKAKREQEELLTSMIAEGDPPTLLTDEEDSVDIKDDNLEEETIVPQRFDVLLGKKGISRDHTGNRRAAQLCRMYLTTYEQSNKHQKTSIAERIMKIVVESGGRFLKLDDDGHWVEADEVSARNKISHMFRYLRAKEAGVQSSIKEEEEPTSDSPSTTTTATTTSTSVKRVSSPESSSEDSVQGQSIVFKQLRLGDDDKKSSKSV
eukprot:Nitzschia sp. Nitz4//scaffold164_size50480//37886//41443//NITZ4_007007-RA/size50480-snap-gene-0.57-mRNA-1//1//CDS//3329538089//6211//frame0